MDNRFPPSRIGVNLSVIANIVAQSRMSRLPGLAAMFAMTLKLTPMRLRGNDRRGKPKHPGLRNDVRNDGFFVQYRVTSSDIQQYQAPLR